MQSNQKMLQEEAAKRNQLENILAEMEGRLVQGATVFEEKEREQAKAQRKLAKELEEEKKSEQIIESIDFRAVSKFNRLNLE